MQKGYGTYSPHETAILTLKTLLISFWVGIDLIAILFAATLPAGSLAQHGTLALTAVAILISGTAFSALIVWATGSLFGTNDNDAKTGFIHVRLRSLQQQPKRLMGIATASILVLLVAFSSHSILSQPVNAKELQIGRANGVTASKCAEIASLEKQLFGSDEQVVLAQCLIQYDEKYAALRNAGVKDKP